MTGIGTANKTLTADGIQLNGWEALYYILPIGSGGTFVPGNLRVYEYSSAYAIPENWVLVAKRIDDCSKLYVSANGGFLLDYSYLDHPANLSTVFTTYTSKGSDSNTLYYCL